MQDFFNKQFLFIVPDESVLIAEAKEYDSYIYKTIISRPCESLLIEINEIIKSTKIFGIITRGSLAHYLYTNNIPVPIFDLKFELPSFLKILHKCSLKGYKKICIFEIDHNPSQASQKLHLHSRMGDYEFIYYKMFNNIEIETTIAELVSNGSVDVLLGDIEPTRIASKYNLPYENIVVDINSFKNTISQARYSTDITLKEKSKNNFIEIITNIISEAVFIVDKEGSIKRYNLQAKNLFYKDEASDTIQDVFDKDIAEILTMPPNSIMNIRDNNYVLNLIPVILDNEQLYAIIINAVKHVVNLEMSIRTQNKERGLTAKSYFEDIIAKDNNTIKIIETAQKYAKSKGTIIIYGETGTGKEIFASSIHNESLRANGPFVAINCATFNENLMESELFGYEKGSFTGALNTGKKGLFELAHRGSIFLDEIGELPLNLQAKLLRVIQEKEIMRIGGNKIIPIDVRIIAATNKNLKKMVNEKLFREDLYYRLALLEIELLPLRQRPKDIIPLLITFLTEIAQEENKSIYWNDTSIFNSILDYEWPGNIRELKNFAERIVLLSNKNKLDKDFINIMIGEKYTLDTTAEYTTTITDDLKQFESDYIKFLLQKFGDDKERLCQYLNISKTTLWRKLNKL